MCESTLTANIFIRPQLVNKTENSRTPRVFVTHPLLQSTLVHPLEVLGQDIFIVVLLVGVKAAGALDCQGKLKCVLFCAAFRSPVR